MSPRFHPCRCEPDKLFTDQPEPAPPEPLRNCSNCGHRYMPMPLARDMDRCYLSGFLCSITRSGLHGCDINFSGWVAAPPKRGLLQRIKRWLL